MRRSAARRSGRGSLRSLLLVAGLAWLLCAARAAAQPDIVGLADADGDGVVSHDEFTAYYSVIWALFAGGKAEVDVDRASPVLRAMILSVMPRAAGSVNRDQLLDAAAAHYTEPDSNKDGVVTLEEFRAWKPITKLASLR